MISVISLLNRLPRSLLAISEQAIQSLYSFLVVAIAARLLSQMEFGVFSLIWNVYPVILLLLSAVLTKPLSIVFPASSIESQNRQALYCYEITMAGWWIVVIAALMHMLSAYMEWNSVGVIAFGVGLMALRMLHEIHRRLNYVQNKSSEVMLYSLRVLLPSILTLPVALHLCSSNGIDISLYIYSGVVWSLFIIPAALSRSRNTKRANHKILHIVWSDYFQYGRHLMLAATIEISFKRMAPYIMTLGAGVLEAGVWAVGRLLVGPAQIILMGIINTALPVLRGAYVKDGIRSLRIKFYANAALVFVLYMTPLLIINIYAEQIIEIVIGEVYAGAVEVLQAYCLAFAVMGLNSLASLYLNARGEVKQQVAVSIAGSAISIFGILYIFQNEVGAIGIASLAIISEIFSFIVLLAYVFKSSVENISTKVELHE